MKNPEPLGTVKDGKWVPANPVDWAFDAPKLEGHPCGIRRIFGKRSTKQGNAWHGIVVPIYMRCMGHLNHDFAHYELVKLIRPTIVFDMKGQERFSPTPTHDMDTKESLELYRDAQDFIGSEYGVEVPDPDPAWKGFKK